MQPFAVRCSLSKTGQRRFEIGPFLPWQNVFKQRKWISHKPWNHRTISDSGISLLVWLWQEEPLLPPSCGQMSACSSLSLKTQPAGLKIWYMTGRLDDKLRAKAIYNVLFAQLVRTRVRIKKVDFSLISVNAFKFKCQSVQHFKDLLQLKMRFSSTASFRVRVMDVQSLTQ